MLDILRKKAASPLTKVILFILAAVFALYFGWSSMGPSNFGSMNKVVATVGKEKILFQQLDFVVQSQLQNYENMYQGKIPDELISQFRQMALGSLIEESLAYQAGIKAGIRASDSELRDMILASPQFQKNGKFDVEYYQKSFRPGFYTRTGIDYEELLRRELITSQFKLTFEQMAFVSDESAFNHYQADNTKMAVQSLSLDPAKLGEKFVPTQQSIDQWVKEKKDAGAPETEEVLKTEALSDLKRIEGAKLAEKLSKDLWEDFKANKISANVLNQHQIKLEDIPLTPLSQIRTFFPNTGDLAGDATSQLFALTKEKPLTDKPIQVGQSYFFIRLTDRQDVTREAFEKEKATYKAKLRQELARSLYDAWAQKTMDSSKIVVHEE